MIPLKRGAATSPEKAFKAAVNRLLSTTGSNPHLLDEIVLAIAQKAKKGDVIAFNALADRLDGKVPQSIGGDAELGPIGVVITGVIRADDELSQDEQINNAGPQLKLVNDVND